jgi:putative DNA primase/helicase
MKMTPISGTASLCLGCHVNIKDRGSFKVGINFNKMKATAVHPAPTAPHLGPATPVSLSLEEALALVDTLHKDSALAEINQVVHSVAKGKFEPIAKDKIVGRIHVSTGIRTGVLNKELSSIELELAGTSPDKAYALAKRLLDDSFKGGAHLLRSVDGAYWVFNGSHWRATTDAVVCKMLMAKAINSFAGCANLQQLVGNAKKTLDHMQASDDDLMGFNDDPLPVVNCANGEVWLDKDGKAELRPHRPESRLTSCLPITYTPAATCPVFDKTLPEIFAMADDPGDMARHILDFFGYAIQPCRDIPCFWLLIGHGANGKSKLLETLQRLVGPAAVMNAPIAKFQSDRFNLAALQGKLLFIDDDIGVSTHLDDGLLKAISEAKEMSARHAYGERHFKFRCIALPVMAGNHFPTTADNSHGLRRRAMVIPFDRQFGPNDANPELFPKIWETELPGVLNRALEGLGRLRKHGGFLLPTDCVRAAQEFMAHANPPRRLLRGRDPRGPHRTHTVSRFPRGDG